MAHITGSKWVGRALVFTVRPSPRMKLGIMRQRAIARSSEELRITVKNVCSAPSQ
ncbi:MAG TPA: hypothetical protein VFT87_00340 [Candidatus Saccharimonadales bacterium]|nr:hypothetical protein [Candidatus Saccharimonadales bacterium]